MFKDFWKALHILGNYIKYIYQFLKYIEDPNKCCFPRS